MSEVFDVLGGRRGCSGFNDFGQCLSWGATVKKSAGGNYRKINIELTTTMVAARLEKKSVCPCGHPMMKEGVPLGMVYNIDLKSVRWVRFQCGGCGKTFPMLVADCHAGYPVPITWLPVELLDIFPVVQPPPMPTEWQAVKDNKITGRQNFPGARVLA